jgi:hypothetical protein
LLVSDFQKLLSGKIWQITKNKGNNLKVDLDLNIQQRLFKKYFEIFKLFFNGLFLNIRRDQPRYSSISNFPRGRKKRSDKCTALWLCFSNQMEQANKATTISMYHGNETRTREKIKLDYNQYMDDVDLKHQLLVSHLLDRRE